MLLLAAQKLPDMADQLTAAAVKAGEVVWERGLLLKGLGLCHGIAGNAYAFLTLWRFTRKQLYLDRAKAFGQAMLNPDVLRAIAQQTDPQRAVA